MDELTPSTTAQLESITLAYCELARLLEKSDSLVVNQLAGSLEKRARGLTDPEIKTALRQLVRRLRA